MTTLATLDASAKAPNHPALRWHPIDGPARQHRRRNAIETMCGETGVLVLAEATDERCPECFPRPRRR